MLCCNCHPVCLACRDCITRLLRTTCILFCFMLFLSLSFPLLLGSFPFTALLIPSLSASYIHQPRTRIRENPIIPAARRRDGERWDKRERDEKEVTEEKEKRNKTERLKPGRFRNEVGAFARGSMHINPDAVPL